MQVTRRRACGATMLLFSAATVSVALAAGSGATASPSAIEIAVNPKVQTRETTVVARIDPRTHKRTPALRFGTARFHIVVSNSSDASLTGVAVVDPEAPDCNRRIGTLAPHASVAYACTQPNVRRTFINHVTASGGLPDGARTLVASAGRAAAKTAARVRVKRPRRRSHIPHLVLVTG
jgi:hypothetical protein